MVNSLKDYKPANISVEKGMDTAIKIRDLFLEEENEREGIFAHEIEINDLLPVIRCMVMGKEFFNQIQELTGCKLFARGVFIEENKKAPLG